MSPRVTARTVIEVRDLRKKHLDEVVRIDALHTGQRRQDCWNGAFRKLVAAEARPLRVGLAAEHGGELVGYLLGEVRAFEFGSEECGWVFAVGVNPARLLEGVASALLQEAFCRFREAGVQQVRTMVRRDSVDVLSFFRANGFVGGSFVQLELDLGEQS